MRVSGEEGESVLILGCVLYPELNNDKYNSEEREPESITRLKARNRKR